MLVTQDGRPLVMQDNSLLIVEAKMASACDRYNEIKKQIEVLEAEKSMLRKQMIEDCFASNDTFMTRKGLVLATYKGQIRQQFKSAEFKKVHPELYDDFSELVELKVLLVK